MRNSIWIAVIVSLLTCGALSAQSTNSPAANPGGTPPPASTPTSQQPAQTASTPAGAAANQPRIAPGSVIPVQLTKTVDAKKAKTGDEVVAKVTQDMKTSSGEVLVPKDTKVIGHVTEAQARNKDQKESQLAIAFNQAVLKNENVPLPMSIQAVIGQQQNNANSSAGPGAEPTPSAPSGGGSSPMGGGQRSPMAGGSNQAPPPNAAPSENPGDQQQTGSKMPPINGRTQGVIGISNLTLSPNSNAQQGSILTSEKNNVKLESGTMLLLRVNQ